MYEQVNVLDCVLIFVNKSPPNNNAGHDIDVNGNTGANFCAVTVSESDIDPNQSFKRKSFVAF